MKYIVKRDSGVEAVIITASGMINTKVAEEMVLAAGFDLKNSGWQKCFFDLADTELDPQQTMTEMFMFIEAFKKAGIDKTVRMAALYVSGGEHRLHLEKAANAEGFNLKHFTDRAEAFNWLGL